MGSMTRLFPWSKETLQHDPIPSLRRTEIQRSLEVFPDAGFLRVVVQFPAKSYMNKNAVEMFGKILLGKVQR